jgi:hypothetical protein
MIRPNLRCFAAAVACLILDTTSGFAQHGGPGGSPMLRMPRSAYQAPIEDYYMSGPGNTELWDESRPIENFIGNVTSRSWLKLEFLLWNYGGDNDQIGAEVSGLQRGSRPNELEGITVPVPLLDNLNGGTDIGQALFPLASSISQDDIPGIRGTLGVALNGAELELSFFGMEQGRDSFIADDLSPARVRVGTPEDPVLGSVNFPNLAVPLLTDGQPTTVTNLNALIFTESFSASSKTQLWGSEISLLTDRRTPGGVGPSWQWLGGFRYVSMDESFGFQGTSVGSAVTRVGSNTINNLYGPELGGRAAFTTKYVSFSATPRVMMGLNDNTSRVNSVINGVAGDSFEDRNVDFGTITQLNLNAEIHFNSHFSIYGGYDFMWLTGVSRPFDNVVYDSVTDNTGALVADIRQEIDLDYLYVHGLSFGATFRY